jgi:hypothetical protein
MSKYIVIPIKISIKNKQFAESGDIVDESQLNTNTHDLVSGGFIRLATEEEIEVAYVGKVLEENNSDDDANNDTAKLDVVADEEKNLEATLEISKKDKVKNDLKNK